MTPTTDSALPANVPALRLAGGSQAADLEEAARLIDDLTALVDAGLVVVRKQIGGPIRYGPGLQGDGAA
jgi:hypothetical protein